MQRFAIILGGILMIAGAAMAQDNGSGFSTGEPSGQAPAAQPQGPKPYVKEKSGDWEVRCIPDQNGGKDRCQLYQLLKLPNGTPIIEVTLGPLPAGQQAVAGAMIITPLETLLPPALQLSIDGGEAKRYPFTFCNHQGCISRVGFTAPDLAQLEKGKMAVLSIYSIANPKQKIDVDMSLNGFSKAYDMLLQ